MFDAQLAAAGGHAASSGGHPGASAPHAPAPPHVPIHPNVERARLEREYFARFWRDSRVIWPFLYSETFYEGSGFACDDSGCYSDNPDVQEAFQALQALINQFSGAANFAPLDLNGQMDLRTLDAAVRAARIAALLPAVQTMEPYGTRQLMELTSGIYTPEWLTQRTGQLLSGFNFALSTAEATWPALVAPGTAPSGALSDAETDKKPLYKKWQFWALLVGTVAVVGGGGYWIYRRRRATTTGVGNPERPQVRYRVGGKKTFDTPEAANEYAERIWQKSGVVVEIREVRSRTAARRR